MINAILLGYFAALMPSVIALAWFVLRAANKFRLLIVDLPLEAVDRRRSLTSSLPIGE